MDVMGVFDSGLEEVLRWEGEVCYCCRRGDLAPDEVLAHCGHWKLEFAEAHCSSTDCEALEEVLVGLQSLLASHRSSEPPLEMLSAAGR
jgi:hypothetical protein